jgi:hypothetical protein
MATRRGFIRALALSPTAFVALPIVTVPASTDYLYVSTVFGSLTGRSPTDTELTSWKKRLADTSRKTFVRELLASPDCRHNIVGKMYRTLLIREPDQDGLQSLSDTVRATGIDSAVIAVLSSDEYYAKRGGGDSRMFVTALSCDILRRSYFDDLDSVVARIKGGAARSSIVQRLLTSEAALAVKVTESVSGLLHRTAKASDVAQFAVEGTAEGVITAVLTSDEFFERTTSGGASIDTHSAILNSLMRSAGIETLDYLTRKQMQRRVDQFVKGDVGLNVAAYDLLTSTRFLSSPASERGNGFVEQAINYGRRDASLVAVATAANRRGGAQPGRLSDTRETRAFLARYLASTEGLGWDASVVREAPSPWRGAPGELNVPVDDRSPPPSFRKEDRIVCTTYFYWYDVINGAAYLKNPDGAKTGADDFAFSVTPSDLDGLSYTLPAWNDEQLRDINAASIDVILPVYFGSPFASHSNLTNGEKAANMPSHFSDPGLIQIVQALNRRRARGEKAPKVGMFYDTTTLNANNAKSWHVDTSAYAGKEWFYETVRNFYSIVPTEHWACIDGKPIIYVYHPSFAARVGEDLYPFVRKRFQAEFGVDLYIVSAAEEEAPRVTDRDGLKSVAMRFVNASYLDALGELLSGQEFFDRAGGSTKGFVERLYSRFYHRSPTKDELSELGRLVDSRGRSAATRAFLSLTSTRTIMAVDLHERIMPTGRSHDEAMSQLSTLEPVRRFSVGGDYYVLLADLLASDEFYRFSGSSTDALVEGVLQRVLWRCTNPSCSACSTTSTDNTLQDDLLVRLRTSTRRDALLAFVREYAVAEALTSYALFYYLGRFYPGDFDSTFYWSAAICPTFRGVVSIGPGYSQRNLASRHPIEVPREKGALYRRNWEMILAMEPRPKMVHIETWNEFFEGTAICDTKEYGREYINLTAGFVRRYKKL